MAWSRDFIGLPWTFAGRSRAGVDCWGLLWLVYREVKGIALASYAGATLDAPERAEIAALIARDRHASPWLAVLPGAAREFDMAVFRRGGLESHIGIVVAPARMLHIVQGGESCIEDFAGGRWGAKLISLHRHIELADRSDAA